MEILQSFIGSTIARLRKERGLTQEQLAEQLGVSAPAVSKWETNSSCPDIALLCPLARALGTNLDTLFQFEEELTDHEVAAQIRRLLQEAALPAPEGGPEATLARLDKLLRQYPSCTALQFNAAALCDSLFLLFPQAGEEARTAWQSRKRDLLEQVRAAGKAAYWQSATIQLAALALQEDRPDQALALLQELPDLPGDPTAVWANYYLKTGQPQEALKITQKQLYRLVSQTQSCLAVLMNPQLLPRPEALQKAALASQALARTFGFPDLSDGALMEACLQRGELAQAAHHFARYAEILTGPMATPDPDLFSPWMTPQPNPGNAVFRQLIQVVLAGIQEDPKYRPLMEQPSFAAALEKLKSAL